MVVVSRSDVEGFEAFLAKVEEETTAAKDGNKEDKKVVVLFSGSKDEGTGKSWCPDCEVALPVVESCLASSEAEVRFVYVSIQRAQWKDPKRVKKSRAFFGKAC